MSMKGIGAKSAKEVIALWLWMESIGHHDLVSRIVDLGSKSEAYLRSVFSEGEACVNALGFSTSQYSQYQKQEDQVNVMMMIPITAGLVNQPIDLSFFKNNKEIALEGITHFLHCICNVIFNDDVTGNSLYSAMPVAAGGGRDDREVALPTGNLMSAFNYVLLGSSSLSSSSSPSSASSSARKGGAQAGWGWSRSSLNPMAKPWIPPPPRPPPCPLESSDQNNRSMFLTFSRGKWGSDCVDTLTIGRTAPGVDPMFGRIVFKDTSLTTRILNGNSTAQFVINGKHLRARMFVPKA
ncbi:hypothetical protein H6P81_017490 [Aristolochia fimbriata]|uniref:Uncharacterized protein n=1 Tax=Aristolochia fimbriata TaxID=158543 RepID=A0AAV7DZR0_ARIFI|nr:hypothetical protein H6P81_017490 [Aristolochia fimbriata]